MGLLLIACTATSILSAVPLGLTLDRSNYLNQLAASDSRVIWTALIEFALAATGAGIAIGLYPVIRRHNRALALGSVAGRVAEGVLVLIGTLSLLVLLTVSQESLAPGAEQQRSGPPETPCSRCAAGRWGSSGCCPFSPQP